MAYLPGWPRSCAAARARRGAGEIGQAVEIALLQHQGIGLLVCQHVLPELGAEARQPLINGRQPVLRRLVERGAGPHELCVIAVEHAGLLGRKAERRKAVVEVGDSGIERPVEIKRVAVAGEQRRDVALDRFDYIAGVGAGQHEEDIGDPVERAAAPLQGLDGVNECRRRLVGGDGVDLGAVLAERPVEGGREMFRLNRAERRQAEGAGPVGEQRVFGDSCGWRVCHAVYLVVNASSGERLCGIVETADASL